MPHLLLILIIIIGLAVISLLVDGKLRCSYLPGFIGPSLNNSSGKLSDQDSIIIIPVKETSPKNITRQIKSPAVKKKVQQIFDKSGQDISEVIVLEKNSGDQTVLLRDKSGRLYAAPYPEDKTDFTLQVYRPATPWFSFHRQYGLGHMISWGARGSGKVDISPALYFYFLSLKKRFYLPIFQIDLYGIGAGFQARFYKNLAAGPSAHLGWQMDRVIAMNFTFIL